MFNVHRVYTRFVYHACHVRPAQQQTPVAGAMPGGAADAMFARSRLFPVSRSLPMWSTEDPGGGGGGGEPQNPDGKGDDLDRIEGLGDKGKEAIRKERADAKAARDEAKTLKDERDALLKDKTDREEADAKAREDEAKQKGEFEKLATEREQERDAAKADAKTLKADNDALREAMKAGIEAGWKELPESVRKLGEKQHPEDDVLGRFQFLNDPDTAALVKQLTGKEPPKRGNGGDPKPSGNGSGDDAAAQKAQRSQLHSVF